MKVCKTLILFFLISISSKAQVEFGDISFNKAVNISGKQRMLGQRMSKAYIYLLENPKSQLAAKELSVSKIIFEKHHNILFKNAQSVHTKEKLEKVDKIWEKLKKIFDETPTYKGAKRILARNTNLLNSSDAVVKSIVKDAQVKSKSAAKNLSKIDFVNLKEVIDISGRQRMLSQRLAMLYFGNVNEIKNKETRQDLQASYQLFDESIFKLSNSKFNTPKIKKVIDKAYENWNNFKNHKSDFFNHKLPVKEIYSDTNELMQSFNDLTALYEKIN